MKLFRYVYRDAGTGKWVSPDFARKFPLTTIRQRIWFWQKRP